MKVIAQRSRVWRDLFEVALSDGTTLGGSALWMTTTRVDNDILNSNSYFPADTDPEVLVRSILDEIPLVCDMEVEWR